VYNITILSSNGRLRVAYKVKASIFPYVNAVYPPWRSNDWPKHVAVRLNIWWVCLDSVL